MIQIDNLAHSSRSVCHQANKQLHGLKRSGGNLRHRRGEKHERHHNYRRLRQFLCFLTAELSPQSPQSTIHGATYDISRIVAVHAPLAEASA